MLCVLFCNAAAAAGAELPPATSKDWLMMTFNFAILVGLLTLLIVKLDIKGALKNRQATIKKSLEDAEEAKRLAEKTLAELKERLENTNREIEEMLVAAKKSGEKEKEAIIAEGEKIKSRILEQTRTNIEVELQKAREAIKSEAAVMALEMAEKQIKERLDKKGHAALIDEYIKKLAHGSSTTRRVER